MSSYYDNDEDYASRKKTALVLGSSGCLGSVVSSHLAQNLDMQVVGVDVVGPPEDNNSLDAFVSLPAGDERPGLGDVTSALVGGLSQVLGDDVEIDAIICASGGWQGDPSLPTPDASQEEFMEGAMAYGQTIDSMFQMNLYPVLAAGYAANRFMADEGM